MSLLERTIDGASDDSVSTGNLLRNMVIIGKRMKSDELYNWAFKELSGYGTDITFLPNYRGPLLVPIEIHASGYMQSSKTYFLSPSDVPDENFRSTQFYAWLTEPMAELEQLAIGESEPGQAWPGGVMRQYVEWCQQGRATHFPDFNPMSARKIISRTMLRGVIDTVRTRALIFALDLQADFPNAGELDGPTIDIPKVREAVTFNINNNIYGGTNTVANGETVSQVVHIEQGDLEGFSMALKSLGLGEAEQAELRQAIDADGRRVGPATSSFIEKLKAGTVKLGGAVATPVAVQTLQQALTSFLGVPA